MRVGLGNRRATRANLLSQCHYFLVSPAEASHIIDEMKAIVATRWRAHLSASGVTERDVERVESAFVPPGFEYGPVAE